VAEIEYPGRNQLESLVQSALSKMIGGRWMAKIVVDRYSNGEYTRKKWHETRPRNFFVFGFHLQDSEEATDSINVAYISVPHEPGTRWESANTYFIFDAGQEPFEVMESGKPLNKGEVLDILRDRFRAWNTARRLMEAGT